jgi:hypothetical protein
MRFPFSALSGFLCMNCIIEELGMYVRAILICILLSLADLAFAEFRTWTDRAGNSIEAELTGKFGDEIIITDRKGRTHKIDPAKLSEEDQVYLNTPPPPPPVKYRLDFTKKCQRKFVKQKVRLLGVEEKIPVEIWEFGLRIEREDGKELPDGLIGKVFVFGEDGVDSQKVVIDKAEAAVERISEGKGELKGTEFTLIIPRNEDGELVAGTKYAGYLVVLFSAAGEVLEEKNSHHFLKDNEKRWELEVGDYFNEQLMKLKKVD